MIPVTPDSSFEYAGFELSRKGTFILRLVSFIMSSFTSWAGKVVVITGANRGIGLAIAKQLGGKGVQLYLACRQTSPGVGAVNLNGGAIITGVDMADDECGTKLAASLPEQVDVLLNNAGILEVDNFESLGSPETIQRARDMYEVNALGPLKITHAVAPKLRDNHGKCFMMSSLMGSVSDNGSGNMYGYRMSKSAMNQAGKCISISLQERKITTQVIHPGFVKTDMTAKFGGGKDVDEQASLLIDVMAKADFAGNGKYVRYDGTEDPW